MNIVTIDNDKLWSKRQKNLLLGSWCINNKHRYQKNKKKNYLISDYHWSDKLKFQNDLKYLYKIYNLFLNNLSSNLNTFHNSKHPTRYWEILLSTWLWTYIVMVFDRWEIIKTIKKNNKNFSVKAFNYDMKNFTPSDGYEFIASQAFSDDWNHWVYSKILKSQTNTNFHYINKKKIQPKFLYKKKNFKSDYYLLNSIFPFVDSKKIYSQNLYFSKKLQAIYAFSHKQFRYKHKMFLKKFNSPLNLKWRLELNKSLKEKDKFVKFLCNLIKYNLPKIYLEDYKDMIKLIEKSKVPKNPKIIMTASDHIYNEAFKFYTAQKVIKGSKYFIFQHGGYYGTCALPHVREKIEIKLADKFFSWGWKDGNKKIIPLFLQKTAYKKINKKNNAKGLIIPVLDYYLTPGTRGNTGNPSNKIEVDKLIDNIELFISQINQNILKVSSFKYQNFIRCNYLLKSFKFKFPNLKFINSTKSTNELSKSFRLIVETNNSSGFLEALNLNNPIIFIYDKKYCSLRKSVIKDFNKLKKVQIIHNSPAEAAKFVNKNYYNLEKWWNSKSLQRVKNNFCHKFARKSDSPLKDLNKVLYGGK